MNKNESQKKPTRELKAERKTIKEEKGQWKNIQCIIYLTLQQYRWVCVCVFWRGVHKNKQDKHDQYFGV